MTQMAETGGGNYYFIDSASKMTSLFDKELKGLFQIAARNAELRIQLPEGVKVETVYPVKYASKANELLINFGDLFSEETKGVLVKFSFPNKLKNPLMFATVLSY